MFRPEQITVASSGKCQAMEPSSAETILGAGGLKWIELSVRGVDKEETALMGMAGQLMI